MLCSFGLLMHGQAGSCCQFSWAFNVVKAVSGEIADRIALKLALKVTVKLGTD
jgi:hypothetical protein